MDIRTSPSAFHPARPKSVDTKPKFGFSSNLRFQNFFSDIEKNDIYETLFKDVLGFNAPRVLTARSPKEGWDTFRSEILNTGVTAAGTFGLAPGLNSLYSKMLNLDATHAAALTNEAKFAKLAATSSAKALETLKLGRMATSLGFMFPFASLFYANPFFRNWWTLKKEKTANFDALIGLDKGQLQKPTEDLQTQLKRQMGMVLKTVGIGAGLGVASVLGLKYLIHNPTKASGFRNFFIKAFENWSLTGEKLNQVRSGLATLIFWSAPAYVGWVHAARTSSERREWWIKFANSTVWFFGTPWITKKFVKSFNEFVAKNKVELPKIASRHETKNEFTAVPSFKELDDIIAPTLKSRPEVLKALRAAKTNNYLFGLFFSIIMLGVTPQLFNRYFTKKRYEARKQELEAQHLTTRPAPPKPPGRISEFFAPPQPVASGWNPWTMQSREPWTPAYPYQPNNALSPWQGWGAPQYYAGY